MTGRRWADLIAAAVFVWVTVFAWLVGCNFDRSAHTASWMVGATFGPAFAWFGVWMCFQGGRR